MRTGVPWIVLLVGCLLVEDEPRPSCSASDRDCREGWACVEGTRPLCPRFCDPTYTCFALGILEPGTECIADSECVDGAFCANAGDGERRCALIECAEDADCPLGEGCADNLCEPTLGRSCNRHRGEMLGCSVGEICDDAVCSLPPEEGGNPCEDEGFCASGLRCEPDARDQLRCTSCATDSECGADTPYCVGGHCRICSDASCGDQVCAPTEGCVTCTTDAHCPERGYCEVDRTCRVACVRGNDESCPSGECAFGEYCVADFGTPCESPSEQSDECLEGVCADVDAAGVPVAPYCTRTCQGFDLPCGPTTVCVDDVMFPDGTSDTCLAM